MPPWKICCLRLEEVSKWANFNFKHWFHKERRSPGFGFSTEKLVTIAGPVIFHLCPVVMETECSRTADGHAWCLQVQQERTHQPVTEPCCSASIPSIPETSAASPSSSSTIWSWSRARPCSWVPMSPMPTCTGVSHSETESLPYLYAGMSGWLMKADAAKS